MVPDIQAEILAHHGARGPILDELVAYVANAFDVDGGRRDVPLDDEPFVELWLLWQEAAGRDGVWPTLARHLRPLAFPIAPGIRDSPAYRRVVGRGLPADDEPTATGCQLERPGEVELELYPSLAGHVPVITARWRNDFVTLVRALARRNEPAPIPPSQGASMVSGLVSWERLHRLREAWEATPRERRQTATWSEEFARLRPHKELYLDRFMILSDGPYSAIAARELDLDEETWRERSLVIRREHECTHYFTRRAFGSMRNHPHDELLADYAGLVAAFGRFRADYFLRFIGLEDFPRYRPGARLDLYRGDPPLGDEAFVVLHRIMAAAAHNVETFDRRRWPTEGPRSAAERARTLRALASQTLAELAAPDGAERLERRWSTFAD